jgi:hypothetical protein
VSADPAVPAETTTENALYLWRGARDRGSLVHKLSARQRESRMWLRFVRPDPCLRRHTRRGGSHDERGRTGPRAWGCASAMSGGSLRCIACGRQIWGSKPLHRVQLPPHSNILGRASSAQNGPTPWTTWRGKNSVFHVSKVNEQGVEGYDMPCD